MTAARRVIVTGRVQGVAFRWSTQRRAESLGLRGWVRNLTDGRVEALLIGDDDELSSMLVWLERGPTGARVDTLDVQVASLDDADASAHESDVTTGFAVRPTTSP